MHLVPAPAVRLMNQEPNDEVVTPLMLDGTYLSRNLATLGPTFWQPPCIFLLDIKPRERLSWKYYQNHPLLISLFTNLNKGLLMTAIAKQRDVRRMDSCGYSRTNISFEWDTESDLPTNISFEWDTESDMGKEKLFLVSRGMLGSCPLSRSLSSSSFNFLLFRDYRKRDRETQPENEFDNYL